MGLVLVRAIEEDEIRLGVTIRNRDMLERAPSCMHTFSRVELVNQVGLLVAEILILIHPSE